MSTQITIRELMERLSDAPVVVVRGISWHVAGVKQQTDRTDGTMRTRLNLTRQDQDGTSRKLSLDVDLGDSVELADSSAS